MKQFEAFPTIKVQTEPVEAAFKSRPQHTIAEKIIGLGYPVYAMPPPRIIFEFIESLSPAPKPRPVFLYSTQTIMRFDRPTPAAATPARKTTFIWQTGKPVPLKRMTACAVCAVFRYAVDRRSISPVQSVAEPTAEKTANICL